jgi:RNA recognition motif-containing protein
LFVGNLSYEITPDQLRELFTQAGPVSDVSIPRSREDGRPRGFAFVEMESAEGAQAAVEKFNGHELDGRALRVDEAGQPGPRPARFGGGGGRAAPAAFRPRPKGSRRNLRARKRGF